MKVSDVVFCATVCREAAIVVCAETHLPYDLYQRLSKAHAILSCAVEKIGEQVPIDKDSAHAQDAE